MFWKILMCKMCQQHKRITSVGLQTSHLQLRGSRHHCRRTGGWGLGIVNSRAPWIPGLFHSQIPGNENVWFPDQNRNEQWSNFQKIRCQTTTESVVQTFTAGHHAVHAGKSTRHLFCTVSVSGRGYEEGNDHAQSQSWLVQCRAELQRQGHGWLKA